MGRHHPGGRLSTKMTALTLFTYGTVCHLCLRPGATTRDHLVPLSKHGRDVIANCRPAHHRCNSKRGNRDLTPELLASFRPKVFDISVEPSRFFESDRAAGSLASCTFLPGLPRKTGINNEHERKAG